MMAGASSPPAGISISARVAKRHTHGSVALAGGLGAEDQTADWQLDVLEPDWATPSEGKTVS